MKNVKINSEFITLGQLLKMEDIISSGGMAKMFLAENEVFVSDELENRRGRKLYPGMIIRIKEKIFKIV